MSKGLSIRATRSLIVRQPRVAHLLSGRKTWELHGKPTRVRVPVAIIEGGIRTIAGPVIS